MLGQNLDFTARGWARVALITFLGTLVSMGGALLAVSYTTQFMEEPARTLTWIAAFVLPLIISVPICFVFASKLRELALAHQQLAIIASQDSLTTCLNRGAFLTVVDAYLSQVNEAADQNTGGLLMIDADHFKAVNDRFGHAVGDDALRLIADSIKGCLRSTDLVGRVGGEEFAVFLPKADVPFVASVAERIRSAINAAPFAALGKPQQLSVSVGGALFKGRVPLDSLYAAADSRMYEAKKRGRNRAIIDPVLYETKHPVHSFARGAVHGR